MTHPHGAFHDMPRWAVAPATDEDIRVLHAKMTGNAEQQFAVLHVMSLINRIRDDGQRFSEASSGWIPVGERLPVVFDKGEGLLGSAIVLVRWPNDWIGTAEYWHGEGWSWVEQDDGGPADADPTHWMPLPEAPK